MAEDVERLREGMRLVSSAVAAFATATGDYAQLLPLIARQASRVFDALASVFLLDDQGLLHPRGIDAVDPDLLARAQATPSGPMRLDDNPTGRAVLATGEPVFVPVIDVAAMRGRVTDEHLAIFERLAVRSMIVTPVSVGDERLGLVSVLRCGDGARPFDALDLELVQELAHHAALAIQNARLVEALRAKEEVLAAQQALLEQTRFLDALIDHLPSMVFVKDAERLAFTLINRSGERLLGLSRAELIGRTDHDFFPPEQAAFFQARDRETLAAGKLVEIPEEPIETRDGPRWLFTRKVPIVDEHGAPTHLLGISYDITDRKRAEAAMVEAKDKAEAASRELEAFSYSVAHDLRAPLRSIDGFSQALLEDYAERLDDTGRHYLTRLREGAQRMALLIDDLLALSRVTRAELTRERIDLSALARTSLARLQRQDPQRTVEVVIEPDLAADADARLVAIALDNLFGNAWKFTSRTPHPRIELGQTMHGPTPCFFVRDNGAGFEMAYVDKLFGVFQRLHVEADFPGTGIGLATVARIIARHRGRVWAEGAVGRGATFYFTLGAS